jgi:hypothetical protein
MTKVDDQSAKAPFVIAGQSGKVAKLQQLY